jgi:hypothetical protein
MHDAEHWNVRLAESGKPEHWIAPMVRGLERPADHSQFLTVVGFKRGLFPNSMSTEERQLKVIAFGRVCDRSKYFVIMVSSDGDSTDALLSQLS